MMPLLLTPTGPSHFLKPEQRDHLHRAYKEAEGPRSHNKSCDFNNPTHLLRQLPPSLFCLLPFRSNSPSLGGYTFLAVFPSQGKHRHRLTFPIYCVNQSFDTHTHTVHSPVSRTNAGKVAANQPCMNSQMSPGF